MAFDENAPTFNMPHIPALFAQLSYAETVHRLVLGANPVRTRLALLQYHQTALNRPPSPSDCNDTKAQRATTNSALLLNFRRATTPSQDSGLEMLDRSAEDTSQSDTDLAHVREDVGTDDLDSEKEEYEYDDSEDEEDEEYDVHSGIDGGRDETEDSKVPDEILGTLTGKCDSFDEAVHTVSTGQCAGLPGCVSVTQSLIL